MTAELAGGAGDEDGFFVGHCEDSGGVEDGGARGSDGMRSYMEGFGACGGGVGDGMKDDAGRAVLFAETVVTSEIVR